MAKTPKEIVTAAYQYLLDIIPLAQKISNPRVEEITPLKEDNKDFWKVVLSYDYISQNPFDNTREFKKFKVSNDGVVISMEKVDDK